VIRESRASFGGFATRVLEMDGSGPPFLLLHGYSDSADTWRPLMQRLAVRGLGAVAVDMPGFGEADDLRPGPIMPQLDEFTAALVQAYAARAAPVLAGNSLGGLASLRAAATRGLPLAGIAPISPAGLGHQPWVDLIEREPIVHRLLQAGVPIPMGIVRFGIRAAYGRLASAGPARADADAMDAYVRQYRTAGDARGMVARARQILPELRRPPDLSRIDIPLLMIWGKHDLLTPVRGSRLVLEAVPHSRLEVLEDCGHCSQIEEPDVLAELLAEFADEAAGSLAGEERSTT
jgi:pimeloyl-ACP methyl ester carboxylesterase